MKLRYLLPALLLALLPVTPSQAFVGISVNFAPPPLPVYSQPLCPVDGYLWTPGYYAYDEIDGEYYWVPGVWVAPPRVGYLWTPGYWGYSDGVYGYNDGYWGPVVGFYGGVNYGFGYGGYGYGGGCWRGNRFLYNTAVTRVNTTVIHNTYIDRTVIRNRVTNSRASFNGPRGVQARPTSQQLAAVRGPRLAPTGTQLSHRQAVAQRRPASPVARNAAFNRVNRPETGGRRQVRRDQAAQRNALLARQPNSAVRNTASRPGPGSVRRDLRRQRAGAEFARNPVSSRRSYQPGAGYHTQRQFVGHARAAAARPAPRPYSPIGVVRQGGGPGHAAHFQPQRANAPHGSAHGKPHGGNHDQPHA